MLTDADGEHYTTLEHHMKTTNMSKEDAKGDLLRKSKSERLTLRDGKLFVTSQKHPPTMVILDCLRFKSECRRIDSLLKVRCCHIGIQGSHGHHQAGELLWNFTNESNLSIPMGGVFGVLAKELSKRGRNVVLCSSHEGELIVRDYDAKLHKFKSSRRTSVMREDGKSDTSPPSHTLKTSQMLDFTEMKVAETMLDLHKDKKAKLS